MITGKITKEGNKLSGFSYNVPSLRLKPGWECVEPIQNLAEAHMGALFEFASTWLLLSIRESFLSCTMHPKRSGSYFVVYYTASREGRSYVDL